MADEEMILPACPDCNEPARCRKCGKPIVIKLPRVKVARDGSVPLPRTDRMRELVQAWLDNRLEIVIDHEGRVWGQIGEKRVDHL